LPKGAAPPSDSGDFSANGGGSDLSFSRAAISIDPRIFGLVAALSD